MLIQYFLPSILALGIITSYEDFKEGKIRNKYVVTAILLSIIIHLILLSFGFIEMEYLGYVFLYVVLALLAGYLFWMLKIWTPGDAKLCAAFISLMPLTTFRYGSTKLPFIDLIFNSVLPLFLFLTSKMLIRTDKRKKMRALRNILKPLKIAETLLLIFSVSWLISLAFSKFGWKQDYFVSIFLIILSYQFLRFALQEQLIYFLLVVSILRVFFSFQQLVSWAFFLRFLLLAGGYLIIRLFMYELSSVFTKNKKIKDLKEGVVPIEGVTSNYEKKIRTKKDETFIIPPNVEGLDKEELKLLKRLQRKGKLEFERIRVHETIPFAPYLFLGTMITLVVNGNLIIFLKSVLG